MRVQAGHQPFSYYPPQWFNELEILAVIESLLFCMGRESERGTNYINLLPSLMTS